MLFELECVVARTMRAMPDSPSVPASRTVPQRRHTLVVRMDLTTLGTYPRCLKHVRISRRALYAPHSRQSGVQRDGLFFQWPATLALSTPGRDLTHDAIEPVFLETRAVRVPQRRLGHAQQKDERRCANNLAHSPETRNAMPFSALLCHR